MSIATEITAYKNSLKNVYTKLALYGDKTATGSKNTNNISTAIINLPALFIPEQEQTFTVPKYYSTNIVSKNIYKTEAMFTPSSVTSSWAAMYGDYSSSSKAHYLQWSSASSTFHFLCGAAYDLKGENIAANKQYKTILDLTNKVVIVDNITNDTSYRETLTTAVTSSLNTMMTFGGGRVTGVNQQPFYGKCNYIKFYNNSNTLLGDFFPVKTAMTIPLERSNIATSKCTRTEPFLIEDIPGFWNSVDNKLYLPNINEFTGVFINSITTTSSSTTSAAYINTNIIPSATSKIELDINIGKTGTTTGYGQAGTFNQSASKGNTDLYLSSSKYGIIYGAVYTSYQEITSIAQGTRVKAVWDYVNKKCSVNSSSYDMKTGFTTYPHAPFLLGGRNDATTAGAITLNCASNQTVYRFRAWDNNKLVRDLVPCRLTTAITNTTYLGGGTTTAIAVAGAYGMWDLVEGKFYGNVGGTGTITGA